MPFESGDGHRIATIGYGLSRFENYRHAVTRALHVKARIQPCGTCSRAQMRCRVRRRDTAIGKILCLVIARA
jgi:hypothetical protein